MPGLGVAVASSEPAALSVSFARLGSLDLLNSVLTVAALSPRNGAEVSRLFHCIVSDVSYRHIWVVLVTQVN